MLREYPITRRIDTMGKISVDIRPLIAAKEQRNQEKLTQERMAYETRLALNTVRAWIRGGVERIDLDTLTTWCEYLECEPGDIVKYDPEEEPVP